MESCRRAARPPPGAAHAAAGAARALIGRSRTRCARPARTGRAAPSRPTPRRRPRCGSARPSQRDAAAGCLVRARAGAEARSKTRSRLGFDRAAACGVAMTVACWRPGRRRSAQLRWWTLSVSSSSPSQAALRSSRCCRLLRPCRPLRHCRLLRHCRIPREQALLLSRRCCRRCCLHLRVKAARSRCRRGRGRDAVPSERSWQRMRAAPPASRCPRLGLCRGSDGASRACAKRALQGRHFSGRFWGPKTRKFWGLLRFFAVCQHGSKSDGT